MEQITNLQGYSKMKTNSSLSFTVRTVFIMLIAVSNHNLWATAQQSKPTPPPPGPESGWNTFVPRATPSPNPTPPSTLGVNGVNRRVILPGYGAAYGTFGEPDFWINPEDVNNKPTFYLGFKHPKGAFNIDAGMQYESEERKTTDNNVVLPGWSMFMNIFRYVAETATYQGGTWRYTGNPGSWDNSAAPWSVPKTEFGSAKIDLHFNQDGRAVVRVKDKLVGPVDFDFPPGAANTKVDYIIRRVVGLTQRNGELVGGGTPTASLINYDGSWVRNLSFSDGHVAEIWRDSNGKVITNPYIAWPAEGQAGLDQLIPPIRNEGEIEPGKKAPWIIDFTPRDPTRPYSTGKRETAEPGNFVPGYSVETTNIELLRKPAEVEGENSKKARSGPLQ